MTQPKQQPTTTPAPGKEYDPKETKTLFGKFLRFIFEATFVLTIVIFGTLVGCAFAVLLPVGFPVAILWKRYVTNG